MRGAHPERTLYTAEYIDRHFDSLQKAALENLTSYVSGWSIYSIDFLNAVAELQGSPQRVGPDAVVALRRGPKRIRDPRLAALIGEANDARSMPIDEIIEMISEKAEQRMASAS